MDANVARNLWVGFVILITYGSIYPANFQMHPIDSELITIFLKSCCGTPHSGDVLANFLLFIPFGFFGVLAVHRITVGMFWVAYVCILGVLLALALQLIQIYLPSRDANLQDVAWNFIGTASGLLLGLSVKNFFTQSTRTSSYILLTPWVLIGVWLAYRLIPFVPSIDFQGVKDSLKPLYLHPELIFRSVFHDTVAWSLVAYFLRIGHRSGSYDIYLPLLIFVTFLLEILIVSNVVSASNVVGAVLAIILWWGVLRWTPRCENILALLLFSMLIFVGLAPFTQYPEAIAFNWLPFHGFLGGSMYINSQVACWKIFLYGSLVYLMWKGGCSTFTGVLIPVVGVALIEFAQTRFSGHTPEISDPILVILIALTLHGLKTNEASSPYGSTSFNAKHLNPRNVDIDANSTEAGSRKVLTIEFVDVRLDQLDFLTDLSEEMVVSIPKVVRRIIDTVVDDEVLRRELGESNVLGITKTLPFDYTQAESDFVLCEIHLREDQAAMLATLAQRVGIDRSSAIRSLIDQFIKNIE